MPEKPLTIVAYAAGASLAAATLVYVFGPTFFLDDELAQSSRSSRKKGVVGLSNPANDCFINSVLQALAGLPELRLYLIREIHRRKLDGKELYQDIAAALAEQEGKDGGVKVPEWKLLGLQQGLITVGLKEILDALNERPIYKKTISAQTFIRVVEETFRTRVSRYQQDAQEFLQIVIERLAEEHHAGGKARRRSRRKAETGHAENGSLNIQVPAAAEDLDRSEETIKPKNQAREHSPLSETDRMDSGTEGTIVPDEEEPENEAYSFPMEGKIESQIECSHCHFKPKPSASSFVTLTLNVPHGVSSTSLNACFDGMLKVEHIDDFKCERCRLHHALEINARQLSKTSLSASDRAALEDDKSKIQHAVDTDPEQPPKDVKLPDNSTSPKRRITRHMRIADFPKVLAVHLNRSVWDRHSVSTKNMAKVSFPETLPLGGLLDRKTYRLLSVVTHKGGHNSGHYETFRRQWLSPPYSTPANMGREGIYSLQTTPAQSPRLSAVHINGQGPDQDRAAAIDSTPSLLSHTTSSSSTRSFDRSSFKRRNKTPANVPLDAIPAPGLPELPMERSRHDAETLVSPKKKSSLDVPRSMSLSKLRRKPQDRWWRISDDKIKESKTSDVLGMQREVYLLFYEMVDEE